VADAVVVSFVKFDGSASWSWTAYRVGTEEIGTDEVGTWLFTPAGTPIEKPGARYESSVDSAMLVPSGEQWAARFFDGGPGNIGVYVDLTLPVDGEASPGLIRIVDMDLDVYVIDGAPSLDDEDEFEQNAVAMSYPPDVIDRIRAEADDLMARARAHRFPFDRDPADIVREFATAAE
jgi:hypothetical protein